MPLSDPNQLRGEKLEILAQLFSELSETEQKDFLLRIKNEPKHDMKLAPVLTTTNSDQPCTEIISHFLQKQKYDGGHPAECPHCGGTHIIKNGTFKGKCQHYLCKECKKTFGDTENTILKGTWKDLEVWRLYIKCMIDKLPLRKTAQICGIHLKTAFYWRHKILDALQNMMSEVQLNGIVEADETYTAISYKGQKNRIPRESHKRGTKAEKRGLSEEKVCIPCGINMNGLSIAKISNLGMPTWKNLQNVLGGKIDKGSILVTDSFRGYHKLTADMEVTHIRIPRKKHTNGTFNIQLLNNYHSQLKELINVRFNGVSTKYLNNYLVYHNFVNFSKGDDQFKEDVMLKFCITTKCFRRCCDISKRSAIPLI